MREKNYILFSIFILCKHLNFTTVKKKLQRKNYLLRFHIHSNESKDLNHWSKESKSQKSIMKLKIKIGHVSLFIHKLYIYIYNYALNFCLLFKY